MICGMLVVTGLTGASMPVKCSKPERPTVTPIHVSELRDARPHGASNREAGQPRKLQHTGPCQDREPGQVSVCGGGGGQENRRAKELCKAFLAEGRKT